MPKSKLKIREANRNDAQEIGAMAKEFADYLEALGDKTNFKFSAETYMRDPRPGAARTPCACHAGRPRFS